MSGIYWFVFTQVFQRGGIGGEPYIVFLLAGLLPWVWFNTAVGDFTKAFRKDARLIRSTAIPRSIWVNRIVLSKGVEYVFSLPVLVPALLVVPHVRTEPAHPAVPARNRAADGTARRRGPARGAAVRTLG